MNKADQDYEELELYLQQAKEEIGLVLDKDRHSENEIAVARTGAQNVNFKAVSTTQEFYNRSSGSWNETCSSVSEHFQESTTTLEVSYDVTFKHDVTLEHEVIIADGGSTGSKLEDGDKAEFKLNDKSEFELKEFDMKELDSIVDLYDNIDFHGDDRGASSLKSNTEDRTVLRKSFSGENNEGFADMVADPRKTKVDYEPPIEVLNSSVSPQVKADSNTFENVVLKLKDFLSERFKDDDSRSDEDSSDEYLTAETDIDSVTKYSGKNKIQRLVKEQSRARRFGHNSSSENDSYLSDVSNLESDFSDCRSLTSEEVKIALNASLESKPATDVNELENHFVLSKNDRAYSKINFASLEQSENFQVENTITVHQETFEALNSLQKSVQNIVSSPEKDVTVSRVQKESEKECMSSSCIKDSYHSDIEESLQCELNDFHFQVDEIEKNVGVKSHSDMDEIESVKKISVLNDRETSGGHKNIFKPNNDPTDSVSGLEDVENLLKKSLQELHRSLSELYQHESVMVETENVSEFAATNLKENFQQHAQNDSGNKYFAILGISSVPPAAETSRKKGRSLSVPEISMSNLKSFPEDEDSIPAEMVVGPYASMSNSYNENWNSSVFIEQNMELKKKLLHDRQNNLEELPDLPSHSFTNVGLSRQTDSQENFESAIKDILRKYSPEHGLEDSRSIQDIGSCTENVRKMNEGQQMHQNQSQNDTDPPAIPESLDRKEKVTLDRKMKHPVTPPPPSANSTENLISDTLKQRRKHSSGTKNQSDMEIFSKNQNFRRKSADAAVGTENGFDELLCAKLNRKSGSNMEDFRKENSTPSSFQTTVDELLQDINKENIHSINANKRNNGPKAKEQNFDKLIPVKFPVLNTEVKDGSNLGKGLHKYTSIATNTSDSLKRVPKIQVKAPSVSDDTVIINNKLNSAKNDSSPSRDAVPTTAKDKKGYMKENINPVAMSEKLSSKTTENKPLMKSFESVNSPEMQVMINSLSPVLLRRNSSKKSSRKMGSDSSESSPETEKKKPIIKMPDIVEPLIIDKCRNASAEEKGSGSLFMDPKMTQTWHGATSANWSQIYGPKMREMMRQYNGENFEDTESSVLDKNFPESSRTLPSSKSLLDEMHKKFCADQYNHNLTDTQMTRALVLLRLKSNKPLKMDRLGVSNAKRSASFHIKMGTGTSGSLESSPMLPRFSERRLIKTSPRIKTSPNMQYPAKPGRVIRDKTPEPLVLSRDVEQTEGPRKEEAARSSVNYLPPGVAPLIPVNKRKYRSVRFSHDTEIEQEEKLQFRAEIEAVEACRWLKETGFPQYAQMYEDGQFPVDIDSVEKDHDFLDKEDIQSLFRRLNTLNKCAIMKIGTPTKKESEDSEDEDECALSDKWKYQRSSRRWSRKDLGSPVIENINGDTPLKSASSHDSLLADQNSSSETGDSPVLDSKMHHTTVDDMMLHKKNLMVDANGNATMKLSPKIRRATSERIKSAKSFLKRVESLKGRRRKPKHISDISGPVVTDNADMQAKIKHLNCKDINSSRKTEAVSPSNTAAESRLQPNLDTSANSSRLSSPEKSSTFSSPGKESMTVSSLERTGDSSVFLSANSTFSESDAKNSVNISPNGALGFTPVSRQNKSDSSSSDNTFLPEDYKPGRFPKVLDESIFSTSDSSVRTRSFSCIDEASELSEDKVRRRGSCDPRNQIHRISIYDNVPEEEDLSVAQQELDIILSELFQNINGLNRAINGEDAEVLHPPTFNAYDTSNISVEADGNDSEHALDTHSDSRDNEVTSGTLSSPDISDHELHVEDLSHDDSAEHIECRERRDSGVGSSLTRTNSDRRRYRIRWHSFQKSHRPNSGNRNLQLCNLSAGQILILRKLSLLKLTALLEKYSPNRSGWSLTVPRFMKRNKVPDYKDKNVFGVPFTVMIQRTGQALPQCVLHAMRFLRKTSRDALGIFRKSGVRSRIQKLRNEIEANPENIDFEELQAYDVADLVKQYFRELPECLLTNKLSDIFISIFIYVPAELRLEAMQAAIVLMVDENRDVLQSLLLFLSDISQYASEHQMTASNLAVCFGPSLFNMGGFRHPNQTPSPRRNRKNPGIPDARELMEQKAAHECLTMMIQEVKKLFTIPAVTISKCRCWHGDPVTLEELNQGPGEGDNQGYTSYIDSCIQGLLKESRDKFRGWVSVPVSSDVDVSYKKVGDGHPLRLWKCTVDVEAPPNEVLNRVLNERQVWDEDLLQWNTIEKLDDQTEVFQYVRNSLAPHPTRDFCVLRSWRSDLPKGACVLISTSIDHPEAELLGGIRAVELASRYLIEPCGTGKSRLTHISRVDIRGHSSDWYKRVYGHICANFMKRVCSSFKQSTDGPETKV